MTFCSIVGHASRHTARADRAFDDRAIVFLTGREKRSPSGFGGGVYCAALTCRCPSAGHDRGTADGTPSQAVAMMSAAPASASASFFSAALAAVAAASTERARDIFIHPALSRSAASQHQQVAGLGEHDCLVARFDPAASRWWASHQTREIPRRTPA